MKTKLLSGISWLVMILFVTQLNAQADPTLTMVDTSNNDVTVTNLGDADIDIASYWVCLGPGQYRQLSALPIVNGDYMLSANESVTFDFPLIAGENADGAGGLGFFSTNSFGSTNPAIYVDFMQWGGPNQDRAGQAVTAGIWDNAMDFISCPTPYSTNGGMGGNPTAWNDADAGIIGIDVDATNDLNVNGTTTIDSEFQATICVDGRPDPIVVFHETPTVGRSYLYVITDITTDIILNIVGTDQISLDGAGPGTCQIWGWSYSGLGGGTEFIGGPLQALRDADCSDISEDAITVVREEADGGTVSIDIEATEAAGGSAIINSDTEAFICLDSEADPIVVAHVNDSPNLSFRYVITDAATGLILNVVNTNSIDLNGVAAGTCEIWGWSYRGVPGNGLDQVGQPLSSLDDLDCSDISDNAVTVIRQVVDFESEIAINLDETGNPNGTTTFEDEFTSVICGDGQADPLVIDITTVAEDSPYSLVIYDTATDDIIDFIEVEGTNAIVDLNGPETAVLEILGVSGAIPLTPEEIIGNDIITFADILFETPCAEFSITSIIVIREVADGGTVSIDIDATEAAGGSVIINSDTEAVICLDSEADPIVVAHVNEAPNLSFRYVITDAETGLILNVVNTNSIDLNGVAAGTCEIWGWSYRGVPNNGLDQIGQPLSALDDLDCSDISDNAVTVIRQEVDFESEIAINLDETGNPNGTTTFDDEFTTVICGDGQADPLVIDITTVAEDLPYSLVVYDTATDDIIDFIEVEGASAIVDFNGAESAILEVLGVSGIVPLPTEEIIGNDIITFVDLLFETECAELSITSIIVIREVADGGTVSIDLDATGNPNGTTTFNGDTEAVICVDGQMDPIVVVHENEGAENLSYRYVITDAATGLILDVVATNAISLDAAGPGTCEIWGWSYRGVPNNGLDQIGQPLSALDDLDCSDISDNAITVIREEADGGTVSIDIDATETAGGSAIINSETEAVICLDSEADPIVVAHVNDSPNLSFRYVITDAATGLILNVVNTNSIDLNGVAAGTCEIWGWSYRGVPGNGLDQIGEPLSALDDLDCSDISDNAITVIRQEVDIESEIAINLDETGNPNGTTTFENEFDAVICGDSQADPLVIDITTVATDLPYSLVVYDIDTNVITDFIEVEGMTAIADLNGPDVAILEILGISGIVSLTSDEIIGSDINTFADFIFENECVEFSLNTIVVTREIADGGQVAIDIDNTDTSNGTTVIEDEVTVTIIAGDDIPDPITVVHENEGADNLSYRYVITDATTGLILNVVDTNVIDLDGVGVGTCQIWGWSYRGVPGNGLDQIGEPLSALDDLDCSDISDNAITVTRDEALSTEDQVLEMSISLYPNPTVDFVNVDISQNVGEVTISVYDLLGRKIQELEVEQNNARVDLSAASQGIYLLEISNANSNSKIVRRIVRQ